MPGQTGKTLSFKVHRQLNRWKDSGINEWSTLVEFGVRFYDCTIGELKQILSLPLQSVPRSYPTANSAAAQNRAILQTGPIRSFHLIRYLWELRISLTVAQQYCFEAGYTVGPRSYSALGFRSDAGGYELRSPGHRYSIPPSGLTHIDNHSDDLAIFDDFIDLLTFVTVTSTPLSGLPDLLVLPARPSFETAARLMQPYRQKHLFLSKDRTGDQFVNTALTRNAGYVDHRVLYNGYTSLNQWVCHIGKAFIPDLPDP